MENLSIKILDSLFDLCDGENFVILEKEDLTSHISFHEFAADELTEILEALEAGSHYDGREKIDMTIGVHMLPKFPKDTTDRNRTSPFAFTGNKFEFRMLGSADSISCTNTIINTIVAEPNGRFLTPLGTFFFVSLWV